MNTHTHTHNRASSREIDYLEFYNRAKERPGIRRSPYDINCKLKKGVTNTTKLL